MEMRAAQEATNNGPVPDGSRRRLGDPGTRRFPRHGRACPSRHGDAGLLGADSPPRVRREGEAQPMAPEPFARIPDDALLTISFGRHVIVGPDPTALLSRVLPSGIASQKA